VLALAVSAADTYTRTFGRHNLFLCKAFAFQIEAKMSRCLYFSNESKRNGLNSFEQHVSFFGVVEPFRYN
jgi:hypothetical protein